MVLNLEDWDYQLLAEAVSLWTGWVGKPWPRTDDTRVVRRYGPELAARLLPVLKFLKMEFDRSEAFPTTCDLVLMEELAIADFKKRYPDLPDEIGKAFAWCYSFKYYR